MVNTKKSLKKNAKTQCVTAVNATEPTHPLQKKLSEFLVHHLNIGEREHQSTNGSMQANPLLLLALSGGLDSTVLLHLLAASRQNLSFSLQAMHVHHGLSPHANAWTDFCIKQCKQLDVPLHLEYINIESKSKLGVEATARKLRYQALFNFKHADLKPDFIVTAHHQDDQAETLLLQ
ncbi:MAG: tRNA lysidine(34) synthetase TilS, partial [Methylotenera sp.]